MRMTTSLAVGAAMIAATIAATPTAAEARHGRGYGYAGYGYGYGYGYRHRNRVDAGDIIAGVLVIGTIAAIADRADRNRRDRYDPRYDDRPYDDRRDDRRYDDRRGYDDRQDRRLPAGARDEQSRAADACGWAAEAQANNGSVLDSIDAVQRDGNGWRVDGRLVAADNANGAGDSFTCGYRAGRVDFVQLGGALAVR